MQAHPVVTSHCSQYAMQLALYTTIDSCTPTTATPCQWHMLRSPRSRQYHFHCDAVLPPPSLVAQTWTRLREMAADRRLSDQNGRAGSWDAHP